MQISFFEEFPTRQNLEKINLLAKPTRVFVAAKSVKEFEQIKKSVRNKWLKEWVYWPILERKEGYWISPFSQRKALVRIFEELIGEDVPVMIDAELPTSKNPWLYLTQFFNFFRNRKLIREFVQQRVKTYTAEYYPTGKVIEGILPFFGLHFDPKEYGNSMIKMMYHSMHRFDEKGVRMRLQEGKERWGARFLIGYGTLAVGIAGDEPRLTYSQLQKDLALAKEEGIKEAVLYRLGGLTKAYARVLREDARA